MNVRIEPVGPQHFSAYDRISMAFRVDNEYQPVRLSTENIGLCLEERPVKPYIKDLGVYERAVDYEKQFDIRHWAVFMAFDGDLPVAGMTLAARTPGVDMLEGRDDLCVLWDLRVEEDYRGRGLGRALFQRAEAWAREQGLREIKIECQNNNVTACRFYRRQGAVLTAMNTRAYEEDEAIKNEIQLIWRYTLA